jgi:hypothetical protein
MPDQMAIELVTPLLGTRRVADDLGKRGLAARAQGRSTLGRWRYGEAGATTLRRACLLSAFVMRPWRPRAPEEDSRGTMPRSASEHAATDPWRVRR